MSQIVKKFIGQGAVGASQVKLENNSYLKSRNAANDADIDAIKVNASDEVEFGVAPNYGSAPTTGSHLANKTYVDNAVSGLSLPYFLAPVRVATLANINLSTIGLGSVDGVTVSSGDRVLVRKQSTASQNGIYIASAGTWARATDFDQNAETAKAAAIYVLAGSTLAGTRWFIPPVATIGTDSVTVTLEGYRSEVEAITLSGGDITNQYVDLAGLADPKSVMVMVNGVVQRYTSDYTVSEQGGNISRVSFAGDLATGGAAELLAGDVLNVVYRK